MVSQSAQSDAQFKALAASLEQRREAILDAWQAAVEADPVAMAPSRLTLADFRDGIPHWLNALCARLRAYNDSPAAADQAEAMVQDEAREHGSHRWQQGYNMRELAREWRDLHLCLDREIDIYRRSHAEFDNEGCYLARRVLTEAVHDGINESVTQYDELQRAEAASHVQDLELVLAEAHEFERARGEALREASHDLRGSLAVVQGAAGLIDEVEEAEPRAQLLDMVQRGVVSVHQMLNDLMDLARLEAGQELLTVKLFDVAAELHELCAVAQPLAQQNNLVLLVDGPQTLEVEGDAIKVRRIAQNLILNALKYTKQGSVEVSWSVQDNDHWLLRIQDSGPGLGNGASTAVAGAPEPPQERRAAARHGEGIGLSIVRRLCELLDARLEMDTEAGVGTTFQITFPRAYKRSPSI